MSLSEQFQENIDNYVNQMSAYNEQLDEYKNQLLEAKGQAADLTKSLVTGVAVPVGTEIARIGATKLFGEAAGEQVGKLAGSALKTVASGDTSSSGILANMRASLGPEADTAAATEGETALTSALGTAKQGLMSVINRVKGGAEDAVAGAEDAVAAAQENLSGAASDLISSVANRVAGQAGSILQQQVARLTSLDGENVIKSALTSADLPNVSFPTGMLGDVELSNMASAVPRAGLPDLSLPFESTYEVPGFTEPMSIPGVSSNIIGRVIAGAKQLFNPEVPDSVIPTQEEALTMLSQQVRPLITSDLLPQGAGEISGAIGEGLGTVGEGLGETIGGVVASATKAISGLSEPIVSTVTSALSGATEAASTVGAVAGEVAGVAAGEAGAEVAAGAAGGPVGLVVGGLIALGTTLYDLFHHDHSAPTIAPVAPLVSLPSFQPGLGTEN